MQRAFEGAAQDAGLRADSEWLRARMGWSKARVFTELLSRNEQDPSRASALVGAFERHLLAIYTESPITPTDGAHEAIAALEASGVEVAFSTGFPRVITDQILGASGSLQVGRCIAGRPGGCHSRRLRRGGWARLRHPHARRAGAT